MAERKSLNDAMTLSPDKLAFIKGATTEPSKASPAGKESTQVAKTIELDQPASPDADESSRPQRRRSRGRAAIPNEPPHNEVLDQILVPVTFRLQHRTAQALKRAVLEQKLNHRKPNKLQEIGEVAIETWLEKSGFLD